MLFALGSMWNSPRRHLEHDPIAFRREQETVAQLIHQAGCKDLRTNFMPKCPAQVRHDDPAVVIEMLFVLWEYFQKVGQLSAESSVA